ncbi:hypothetical protein Q3G72_015373 [Acer saccharum]|nr:hypothetical protein Q3G72_015373 [Acer saccharum]
MKLPYFAERTSIPAAECREKCLNNCSCMAYAYEAGIHCMTWTGSLIDLQKFPINGEDLYIRLDQSELETGDKKVVIIVPVVVGIITFAICTFFLWRWMAKRKALKEKGKVLQSTEFSGEYLNEVELQDLPLFDFEKIFGGNEDQANTIRVVGTFGYMSPEYVMEGRFSEKSDVFSFGVLLLEIVSGRKNTGFFHDTESLSLLGYAWKLWNENNIVALLDPVDSKKVLESQTFWVGSWLIWIQTTKQSESAVISIASSSILFVNKKRLASQKNPICSCVRGFEPKNKEEWSRGNWTNGCIRKRLLLCDRTNQTGEAKKEDGFLKLETMKLPYFAEQSSVTVAECRERCLNNCSCIAYAYDAGIGCMTWTGSLIDLNKFSSEGADLYIRLAHSELGEFHDVLLILMLLC